MREIRVASPTELIIAEAEVPTPGPGEVLVRNRYFTVVAALRTLLVGGVPGTPMPALRPGDVPSAPAIGEIVDGPGRGTLVRHMRGWREYAVVPLTEIEPVDAALPDPVAHFANGTTAYGALTRAVQINPGDTVFVSGGAGAVGSLASQIARLLGAGRVIGSTGSASKAARMLNLGYDAVITRPPRTKETTAAQTKESTAARLKEPIAAQTTESTADRLESLEEQLAKAAPGGIDVVFDNVGGDDLRAALAVANRKARFALIGALSGQLAGTGASGPVELDTYRLILKQITMTGYSAGNDPDLRAEWDARFAEWLLAGRIEFPHVIVDGLDRAPSALHDVWQGRHFGTVVVKLE